MAFLNRHRPTGRHGDRPLLQQQHLLDRGIWTRHNLGDINATTNAAAQIILSIPLDIIATCCIMLGHQMTDLLPGLVVNHDRHICVSGQIVGNRRSGVKRIGDKPSK